MILLELIHGWQLVCRPLSVITVQRAIARLLPIFYSTESHYETILIGATSHKRGRLYKPLSYTVTYSYKPLGSNALNFDSFGFAEAQSEGDNSYN